MGYSVEKCGKTIEEAIELALEELNVQEENTFVEVLDEGTKGIFGILGNKMAKVRVSLRESSAEKAKEFLVDVFHKMNIDVEIEASEDEESLLLNIIGQDVGIIIGRRGETLDSLQYLTSIVVNKDQQYYKRVVVDIENYRQKREDILVKLADRLAEKVVRYKKSVTLEPMNPYERRIIHSSLQSNRYVETYSVGDEPNRKVIIELK